MLGLVVDWTTRVIGTLSPLPPEALINCCHEAASNHCMGKPALPESHSYTANQSWLCDDNSKDN